MSQITRFLSRLLVLALIMSAFGPSPVARADDGQPSATEVPTPPAQPTTLLGGSAPPPSGCTPLTTQFGTGVPNLPIPDNGVLTATTSVVGMGTYLWDLDLQMNLIHTNNTDLDMVLISPQGTQVTLSTDNGGTNDNVFGNTTWDDQWGGASVSDYVYSNGVAVPRISPEEAMGAFIGENPNGIWTLVITDDTSTNTGTLQNWSIIATTIPTSFVSQTYSRSDSSILDINDMSTITRTLSISGRWDTLSQITLTTDITHTYNGDLDIYLMSPGGISVTITSDNAASNADVFNGTTWDDHAGAVNPPGPVTDQVYSDTVLASPLVIENALAAFNGTDPNGDWKLIITDDALLDVGQLRGWELYFTAQTCLPDLSISKFASNKPLGQQLVYGLTVQNYGAQAANAVVITDALPVGTTFVSLSTASGWSCSTPAVGGTGIISCTKSSFAAGDSASFSLTTSPVTLPQYVPNTAYISSASAEPLTSNNSYVATPYTGLTSLNGNYWDVRDDLYNLAGFGGLVDTGSIDDGSSDAFDTFGQIHVNIQDAGFNTLTSNQLIDNLDLTYTGGRRWETLNPRTYSGVITSRAMYAPPGTNYVRYLDTFTNTTNEIRHVYVAWGGDLGSDTDTTVSASSSGDLIITTQDQWAVTTDLVSPPGAASDPPVGYAFRSATDVHTVLVGDMNTNPFINAWPGNGDDDLGLVFAVDLAPGQTARVAYFLYRGRSESGSVPDGSEVTLAQTVLMSLSAHPDFCDLTPAVIASLVNWPNAVSNSCVFLPLVQR